MRSIFVCAGLGLLLSAAPVLAQPHKEVRTAFNAHWAAHPEHPEALVRLWHQHLFHCDIGAPLLGRLLNDLKRGIEAPLALAALIASPEFYIHVGGTPEGFVRGTFTEVVGRAPTATEYRFWLDRMHHADRNVVAHEMITRYPPAWAAEAHPVEHFEYRAPVVQYHR
jgi:hypothetical protein